MDFENATQAVSTAIRSIFERWTALKLVIEHQMGGVTDDATKLMDTTISMATSPLKCHDEDDFIDLFYDAFDQMHCDVEDGSLEEIASQIVRVRDAAKNGDYAPAVQLVSKANKASTAAPLQSIDGGEAFVDNDQHDHDDDKLSLPSPTAEKPMMDDDGFTEVRRGGGHR
ncbi:unnamed protein product [Agarophyton chilense]